MEYSADKFEEFLREKSFEELPQTFEFTGRNHNDTRGLHRSIFQHGIIPITDNKHLLVLSEANEIGCIGGVHPQVLEAAKKVPYTHLVLERLLLLHLVRTFYFGDYH